MRPPTREDVGRVRRRLRLLAGCIDGPNDLRLAVRMLGWRIVLPALKYLLPLPRLARLMWTEARSPLRHAEQERRIIRMARGMYGPQEVRALDNCLERSLVLYRFLSEAGATPRLVVGMRSHESLRGHAWVILDGDPVHETAASLEQWVPILAFGACAATERLAPRKPDPVREDIT